MSAETDLSGQPIDQSVRSRLARAFAKIADCILPPLCLSCRNQVERHGELCPSCWVGIDFIASPICDRLGIPLPYGTGDKHVSAAALANPPDYDRARAAVCYGGVARSIVHDFKFRDRHDGRRLFGRWLAQAGQDVLSDADWLVPVPLHRRRLWQRRFNQSALLAQSVSSLTDIPFDPFLLRRTRSTANQVGLTRDQRSRNVAGAFEVSADRSGDIAGRNLVLVDDVMTTGATANACAKALSRAGASRVDVLVLARVVDPLNPTT